MNSSIPPPSTPYIIRPATIPDIPRLATIAIASLPDDPSYCFLWRHRKEYPDQHFWFWTNVFKGWVVGVQGYGEGVQVIVAEYRDEKAMVTEKDRSVSDVQELGNAGSKRDRIVEPREEDRSEAHATIFAFAVWEHNGFASITSRVRDMFTRMVDEGMGSFIFRTITNLELTLLARQYPRIDGSLTHLLIFERTMNAIHRKYWSGTHAIHPHNYRLELLATHPDYRRRGAGTQLTRWGMAKARDAGVVVGLEASPMGRGLYAFLGFEESEFVRMGDVKGKLGDEWCELVVMVWNGDGGGEKLEDGRGEEERLLEV